MRPSEFLTTLSKGKAGPAYFLRGIDRFLHEECRKAVIAAIPPDARPWCLAEFEFEPGRLRQELEGAAQMPMLGGHSFLLFSDPEDFKHAGDEDMEALKSYFARPSPFATLVFAAVEPDRRRKFITLLEKQAELVEMLPLNRREAARWAEDFLRQAGTEIDHALAEEVAAKFEVSNESRGEAKPSGVNLLWMRTELEKLLTAVPEKKRLEAQDLELIVAFREEREIGKLLRAMAERQCSTALNLLRALLGSKVAEALLLWNIANLFRQALRDSAGSGRGPAYGGWSRPGNLYSPWELAKVVLSHYTREEMLQALRAARRADLRIKSSWKDSRILLEFLVWQIVVGKAPAGDAALGEELPAPASEV